jgi:hypothetical protein
MFGSQFGNSAAQTNSLVKEAPSYTFGGKQLLNLGLSDGMIGQSDFQHSPAETHAMNCVVYISTPDMNGSGVLIDGRPFGLPHHCILTNNHVLPNRACTRKADAEFILGGWHAGTYQRHPVKLKFICTSDRASGFDFTVASILGNLPEDPVTGDSVEPLPFAPRDEPLQLNQEILLYQFPATGYSNLANRQGVGDKAQNADNTPRKMVSLANIARIGPGDQKDHYHLPYFSRFPNMVHCNCMGVAFVNTHTDDHIIHHGSSGCPMIKLDREGSNIGPRVVGLANGGNETIGEAQDGSDASAYMCLHKQGFGITSNTLTKELTRVVQPYLELQERRAATELKIHANVETRAPEKQIHNSSLFRLW